MRGRNSDNFCIFFIYLNIYSLYHCEHALMERQAEGMIKLMDKQTKRLEVLMYIQSQNVTLPKWHSFNLGFSVFSKFPTMNMHIFC